MDPERCSTLGAVGRAGTALVFTLVILLMAAMFAPRPAEAWYRAGKQGRPGSFTAPKPMAIDSYDGLVMYLEWRTARGPLVYRSPATRGPQNVLGIYTVQEWTPSFGWTNTTSQTTQLYRIPRGVNAVRLPALDRAPQTTRGYFRVAYTIAWVNARTNAALGTAVKLPNLATDHRCITDRRPCATGEGFIRAGRLYTHGGGW